MSEIPQELNDDFMRVQALWDDAFTEHTDPHARNTEARLLGINFRIDVAQAFKAVWETTKLTVKAAAYHAKGAATPSNGLTWQCPVTGLSLKL